jgi:hypothetical protein
MSESLKLGAKVILNRNYETVASIRIVPSAAWD